MEHKISLQELYQKVNSSDKGLSTEVSKKRLDEFGPNIIKEREEVPVILLYLRNYYNFFALLLIVGSGLAFFAETVSPGQGNLYIGIALIAVVILNATFTFIQEYQSEKIMQGFRNMMPAKIKVLRDGKKVEIVALEVVPGDIIFLEEGDKVPADGRLIDQHILKVDHSMLTGESEPQLRSLDNTSDDILQSRNMVFSGTLVQSGTGTAVIYGTGMDTQIGKIASLTKKTSKVLTPIRKELNYFIKIISGIAIFLGILFFIVSLFLGKPLIGSLIFAIGIIVANVPEGLLPTVTLALSMASRRMAKKNALIKNLESVETLGSTTVICTDKTGTLTQNKMFVHTIFANLEEMDEKHFHGVEQAVLISALCNNARLKEDGYLGDPTEGALLEFANQHKDINKMIEGSPRKEEIPFDSNTKCMTTFNNYKGKDYSLLKGAPEIVLAKCDKIQVYNETRDIQESDKQLILNHYKTMASRGERVLALAFKESNEIAEEDFVFVALTGMIDPPRPEIPSSIDLCHEAGIKVIMITGDSEITAEAIARKVGIVHGKANILTGKDVDTLSEEELREFLRHENVIFARTSPEHKLHIVNALQANGEIVAVTGDGVNDAPALKNADIGVAMGSGTEVSKEASNMVLLDNNFATIVNAIEQGRTIYANIKKFIAYILTSNIPEILPFIAFVLLGIPLPLTVILILAIDLGTDLVPALGLGQELPESDVMKEKPRSRKERLLTPQLLFNAYGIIGMLQAAAGFTSYFAVLFMGGWTWGQYLSVTDPLYMQAITAFFASIIFAQIPDVLICRTRRQSFFKHTLNNKLIYFGILTELALLAIIAYTPARVFFGTMAPDPIIYLIPVPFMIAIFAYDEMRKYLIRSGNVFVNNYLRW